MMLYQSIENIGGIIVLLEQLDHTCCFELLIVDEQLYGWITLPFLKIFLWIILENIY